jgi:integrase
MKVEKPMSLKVEEYVATRRQLGYELRVAARELRRFARYAETLVHHGPLNTELVLSWARSAAKSSPLYQARRVEIVRPFAKYLAAMEPGTQIPPQRLLGPAHRRIQPHIYDAKEVALLMRAAGDLTPDGGLRPMTYQTLLGLLASTGLRVCEALKLDRTEVDLTHNLLTVRETKFRKSRLVPIHESVTRALSTYVRFRDSYYPCPRSHRFLLSEQGTALLPSVVHYTFQKLRRNLSCGRPSEKPPRLYDLRHTFACQRLLHWYREGIDVQHAILSLSAYLGHVKVSDTYWYLSGIPELLAIAAQRFEHFSNYQSGGAT